MSKLVFVTGGSRGIGAAIVKQLACDGYKVAFSYRENQSSAHEVVQSLGQQSEGVLALQMDQADRSSVKEALSSTRKHFQRPVSILVNNAAKAQEKPFEEITDDDWQKMLDINLQGPFRCVQECLSDMKNQKFGRIINISSIGGQWGGRNQVHYAASKAALINFTQSLANLYSKDGIVSTAVAVGLVATDMSAKELSTEAGRQKVAAIPAGRLGSAKEIAESVSFLCTESAAYLTGQTINMNGGMLFS